MTGPRSFALAVWDFLVGDDWRTAVGVVIALAATALIATTGTSSWWVLPSAVAVLLGESLRREAQRSSRLSSPVKEEIE